jgi:hypothetical protein
VRDFYCSGRVRERVVKDAKLALGIHVRILRKKTRRMEKEKEKGRRTRSSF